MHNRFGFWYDEECSDERRFICENSESEINSL